MTICSMDNEKLPGSASLPAQESAPKAMVAGAEEFVTAINLDVLCAVEAEKEIKQLLLCSKGVNSVM